MASAESGKCSSQRGHLYERHDANTWKCVYCGKRYTFDPEDKGWK